MTLKDKIERLVTSPIEEEGFELIELKLAQYRRNCRLQLFIDSDHGVNIDDCARLSKAIGPILEASRLFPGEYTIEVSSPGLDRPLRTTRDFRRRIGERIKIFFNDNMLAPAEGILVAADEQSLELQIGDGNEKYDLVAVRTGKIVF